MDDLTQEQVDTLRARLVALRGELEAMLLGNAQDSAPVDLDLPIGRVSRIDAIQQQKMAQASRRKQGMRLQQVKAALKAMENDEYGYCRRCDEVIAYKRLLAQPETPFCLDCKNQMEAR